MIPSFVRDPNPQIYHTGRYVVVDFETTNINKGSALTLENNIVMAAWSVWEQGSCVATRHKFGGIYDQAELVQDIEGCDFLVAQSAKFELSWLARCGYDIGSRPVYDTLLAEWVIASNRGWRLNLDATAARYGLPQKDNLVKRMIQGGICPSEIPKSLLLRYCHRDVDLTQQVMQAQLAAIEGTRLLPIIYTQCLVAIALSDIEKNGMQLDSEAVLEEYNSTLQEWSQLQKELAKISGGINLNSPIQLAEFLYDTLAFAELCSPYTGKPLCTPSGRRKTDGPTLSQLVAKTKAQKRFLELKTKEGKLRAALSKNLEFFKGVCDDYGGLFYGELNQGRARTGRLTSTGRKLKFKEFPKEKSCQFQNLPNQYKPLIRAKKKGWYIAEADGSALEFRVAGHLGHDQQIISDILNKEDIHSCTAAALTAAGEPTSRRDAKATTFKPAYGGSMGSPAVMAYCEFFNNKYHELHAAQREWALVAADKGEIETEWGMKFYFPDVKVRRDGSIHGQQQVFNYPIQRLATGEIIPVGLVFFWFYTRNAELKIVNTVHDSIICEVPKKEIELFEVYVVKSLTTDVYDYLKKCYRMKLEVPLGVGLKIGPRWGVSGFSDEELAPLCKPLIKAGYDPIIDDGEISVDVAV